MLKQLRLGFRTLFKYRLYTGFALIGFSVAVSAVWFIADYVRTSYKYDAFHTKHDRIYRLSMEIEAGGNTDHYASTGKPLGEVLQKNYPGIEGYSKLKFQHSIVRAKGEAFRENAFFKTNPQTLSLFTFDFIAGDEKSLYEPNSIVLSKSLALKYFDGVDIVGKPLLVNDKNFIVKGVFQDWPKNSHIEVNALLSLEEEADYDAQSWFDIEQYTYALVDQAIRPKDLDNTLDQLAAEQLLPLIEGSGLNVRFKAQPLKEVFFSPGLVDDVKKGSLIYTNSLAIAGLLVLLIAALNFINLTLTRSTQRSKEIIVKKILGITRKQLVLQSAVESLAMVLLVILLSIGLIFFFEKFYTGYSGFVSWSLEGNGLLIAILVLLIFVSGLLGSSYSGIYLSFSSHLIPQRGVGIQLFKKILLGFQYSIASIVLIITLTMGRQLDFIKNKDLGFNQQEVIILPLPENDAVSNNGLQFREHIKNIASVKNASLIGGGALPGEENGKDLFEIMQEGSKIEKVYNIYRIDEQYIDLLDIKMDQGRNFNPDMANDQTGSVIINEALAKSLNWEEPLGREIWYGGERRKVIGLIKNFHNKSLHNLIEPIVFLYEHQYANNLLIKAPPTEVNAIKSAWDSFYPEAPFSVTYFDQFIGSMYEKEHRLTQLFWLFSVISMMLCAMGLFALFSLHVQQKTREISIRKVLGANYSNLLKSIIKNYRTVLILPIVVAFPIAWFLVRRWLSEFSFNVPVGFEVYLLSGFIILSASFAVIAYHLLKVLKVDPVIALKSE